MTDWDIDPITGGLGSHRVGPKVLAIPLSEPVMDEEVDFDIHTISGGKGALRSPNRKKVTCIRGKKAPMFNRIPHDKVDLDKNTDLRVWSRSRKLAVSIPRKKRISGSKNRLKSGIQPKKTSKKRIITRSQQQVNQQYILKQDCNAQVIRLQSGLCITKQILMARFIKRY